MIVFAMIIIMEDIIINDICDYLYAWKWLVVKGMCLGAIMQSFMALTCNHKNHVLM
jgi:hypothetical protein